MAKKKKWPVTLALAVVVAGLAGYCYYDFKHNKDSETTEGEQKAFSIAQEDIADIKIEKQQKIHLKKEAGDWQLVSPIEDKTDSMSVNMVLSTLTGAKLQKVTDTDSALPDSAWAQYGLNPGVHVEITSSKGLKEELSVSEKGAFDGSFYIRRNNHLYLGERGWAQVVSKPVDQLRTRKIWRADGDIVGLQWKSDLNGKTESALLAKEASGQWKISPAQDLDVSPDRIRTLLSSVRDLQASAIELANPTPADQKKMLLLKPSLTVTFKVKKDDKVSNVTWVVGQDRESDVFIEASDRHDVMRFYKTSLRDIRVPLAAFLDASAPLNIDAEKVQEIALTVAGKTKTFSRSAKDWTMKPSPDKGQFQPTAIADFLQKLKNQEPIGDWPPKDLQFTAGNDNLVIKGKDKNLLGLNWSAEKAGVRWLRFSGKKELFKVTAEKFNSLLKTEFVKIEAPQPPKSQPNTSPAPKSGHP